MGQFGSVCDAFNRRETIERTSLIVQVEQGKLRGKECRSAVTKEPFCSFLGIPYAKPPVGELRFRPPESPEPWHDVYDATSERSDCSQKDIFVNIFIGDEDCLYMNVYTPKPPREITTPLPVMVFVHGGGFIFGSGSRKLYSADLFMKHDIILVTFNYRLHALGFLNLGIPECPGNVGMKDQVWALKWVQKNIKNFGGDPNNVTIFGESAGASSVHYLMISPLSQGLFNKAILQSGSALAQWAYTRNPIEVAFSIGRRAGFRGFDRRKLLQHLKNLSATRLTRLIDKELTEQQKNTPARIVNMSPSVEFIKEGAFLPDSPLHLMKQSQPIPCIWGYNDEEGFLMLKALRGDTLNELRENFGLIVKNLFQIDSNLIPETAEAVKQLYFGDKEVETRTGKQFVDLMTDTMFYRTYDAVEPHFRCNTPLYMYKFRYKGRLNFITRYLKLTNMKFAIRSNLRGACHGDELFYMFYAKVVLLYPKIGENDSTMINNITTMWTNFAKTGNPSTDSVEWKPCTEQNLCYLDIGATVAMEEGKIGGERFEKLHAILDSVAECI